MNTQVTQVAKALHSINDETPKDQGRVDRESIVQPSLDPLMFEKEKVFQLVLDSSVVNEESEFFDSQMPKRLSGYRETSFDSLHTVDLLFVTGANELKLQEINDID